MIKVAASLPPSTAALSIINSMRMAIIIGASERDSPSRDPRTNDGDVAESALNRGRTTAASVVAGCARMNIIQAESDRSKSFPHPGKREEGGTKKNDGWTDREVLRRWLRAYRDRLIHKPQVW